MMRKVSFQAVLAVTASAMFAPLCAQDAEAPAAEAPAAEAPADGLPPIPPAEKPFTALFKCARAEGVVQVLKPGASEWTAAEEGRFYPLGSALRTVAEAGAQSSAEFAFGPASSLKLAGSAEVVTRPTEIGGATRTVELKSGRVQLNLPRTLKDGLFFVAAPFFTCSNLAGESQFDYQLLADGDEAVVRCVTGTMTLEGRHYRIARMAAANQVRIRSTGDNLYSWLRGESGDSKVELDQGMVVEKNFETDEDKEVKKTLEFTLSPRCAVKIFRRLSPVGGNMLVSTMTIDAAGEIKNRCAFAEGRANVNSGELVIAPAVVADAEKEKAKVASEETEEVEAVEAKPAKAKAKDDAAEEEKKDEEKDEKEEKKDEKKDDDI
ncbi:MAG: hypothetical protein IJL17_01100 [Kiritimatiellae bacterium]|nr:hypothetical protein [Kiritimatiellia bacterium]